MVLLAVRCACRTAAGMMAVRRRWRQRAARTTAGLLAACLLAGCAPPQSPGPVLRVGLAQPVLDVDPRQAADAASARLGRLLYSRLVELDADYRPRPAAADWQQLDPLRWRFTLRAPRPRFGDGTPLSAADVVATYRAVLGEGGRLSPLRAELGPLRAVQAAGDGGIDFILDRPEPMFPARLTLGIVRARCAGPPAAGERPCHYDGSGPFALQRLSGSTVRLRRRRDGLAVVFEVVPDPTVR
jgi:peptide/nickel transport system substrate-binding protein